MVRMISIEVSGADENYSKMVDRITAGHRQAGVGDAFKGVIRGTRKLARFGTKKRRVSPKSHKR